ncbi:MAG TPA: hemolysin III family protein [Actinomycetes bacterium]|nr:hemolysin III family protein [Actinomycetes bacterium]
MVRPPDDMPPPDQGRLRRAEEHLEEAVDHLVDRALDGAERRIGQATSHVPVNVRPKLRGWLHLGAVPLALVLGTVALFLAPAGAVRWSVLVYLATTVLLFAVSATYHRRVWGPTWEGVLKRLDHSNIYLFIAGSYTPFAVALLPGPSGKRLLTIVWSVAALGIVFRVLWVRAPRWLYVATYMALGWVAVAFLPDLWRAGGPAIVILIAAGGLLYSLGAVFYALKRPNPWPTWFGFHELFHAFTIAAYLTQYVAVLLALRHTPT